jgi:hypothetical protein
VLVDLSLADVVVLGAVAVVAEVAAVCAETWRANKMVIARSTKRRDMLRNAIAVGEVYEKATAVIWSLGTTKRKSDRESMDVDLQGWSLAVAFSRADLEPGFTSTIIADHSFSPTH